MKYAVLGLKLIYSVTLVFACFQVETFMDGVMILVSCILPLVFPFLFRLFNKKMPIEWQIVNITFIFFASLIGSCLGGYSWPLYDKIIHFFSGMIAFSLGLFLYHKLVKVEISNSFKDLFCHLFNLSVAVIWEFYEYLMLVFFNHDCIRHYTSGVHDALTDMICAFLGGVVVFLLKRKTKFFENLAKS